MNHWCAPINGKLCNITSLTDVIFHCNECSGGWSVFRKFWQVWDSILTVLLFISFSIASYILTAIRYCCYLFRFPLHRTFRQLSDIVIVGFIFYCFVYFLPAVKYSIYCYILLFISFFTASYILTAVTYCCYFYISYIYYTTFSIFKYIYIAVHCI